MHWDLFCRVVDNYGDIGVCWRLAADLAARGEQVRLWVDDAAALRWMAPAGQPGVQVLPWPDRHTAFAPGDAVIEAFGCELPAVALQGLAAQARSGARPAAWLNLEYLTAEDFAQRAHGLPSPVFHGPAAGLTKHFFYPGFTPRTGGLLREPGLLQRRAAWNADAAAGWLGAHGIGWHGERLVSLFCYEPPALAELLDALARGGQPVLLLVTAGRAAAAVAALGRPQAMGALRLQALPLLAQADYDRLLWSCDLNFVRGEDSLVRALWAARPLVWQAYPQHDGAHHAKLQALLAAIDAPGALVRLHRRWNGIGDEALPAWDLPAWTAAAQAVQRRLAAQPDLASQLLRFVEERR